MDDRTLSRKRGDRSPLFARLTDGGAPVNLEGATVVVLAARPRRPASINAPVTGDADGRVVISEEVAATMTEHPGTFDVEFDVIRGTARQTYPGRGYLTLEVERDLG